VILCGSFFHRKNAMIEITSTENQILRHIRKLSVHSYRAKSGETVLEGERLVCDSARYGGEICSVLVREDYAGKIPLCEKVYKTSAKLFDALTETKTPQGILAIAAAKLRPLEEVARGGLTVVCDRVQDPGNLGTIFRTAHAFGADGVILLKGCVDPFSPKTVRSSMGSVFALPIAQAEEFPRIEGYTAFCGTLSEKAKPLPFVTFPKASMIVLGNEANGASAQVIAASETHVLIPMPGGAESLNVAAAGAIMLYEYRRQLQDV